MTLRSFDFHKSDDLSIHPTGLHPFEITSAEETVRGQKNRECLTLVCENLNTGAMLYINLWLQGSDVVKTAKLHGRLKLLLKTCGIDVSDNEPTEIDLEKDLIGKRLAINVVHNTDMNGAKRADADWNGFQNINDATVEGVTNDVAQAETTADCQACRQCFSVWC